MGPSSQGNELIYYQALSVGGRLGFWEKWRLLTPEPRIYAVWGKSVEMFRFQTMHCLVRREGRGP